MAASLRIALLQEISVQNNVRKFENGLRTMKTEISKQSLDFFKRFMHELCVAMIMETPVGNPRLWKSPAPKWYRPGTARRNWRLLRHKGGSSRIFRTPDPTGQLAMATCFRTLAATRKPEVLFLVNPVPYMPALETGWSSQAPSGITRVVAARLARKYGTRYTTVSTNVPLRPGTRRAVSRGRRR
jgi:hypothetical protein